MLLRIQAPLLSELLIIFGLAITFILLLRRLRLPSVIGFLLAGAFCGTNGINLHDYILQLPFSLAEPLYEIVPAYIAPPHEEVEVLAEIGVVLLLFTIGLEFSIASLIRLKKAVFLGGTLQVALTIAVFAAVAYYSSYDYLPTAVFLGFLFALSSTAIVLKLLQESGEINKPHGQVILAILIFQDVAVVPMMLFLPMMAGGDMSTLPWEITLMLLKLAAIVLFMYLLAKFVLPFLLYQVARTKSKDLFIVSMVAICFAIAFITGLAGLSYALGAFVAGLVIAESKYGHQAVGSIIYFKELFTSIFFISVGLMLDLQFVSSNLPIIAALTGAVLLLKGLVGAGVAMILKGNPRTVIGVALSISQVGEFSFILAKMGEEYGLMPIEINQYFLCVAVSTMMITPIFINYTENFMEWITHSRLVPRKIRKRLAGIPTTSVAYNLDKTQLKDHIVILGHNLTARTLIYGAKSMGIPYVVIEYDPRIVEAEHKKGEPIIYGDPTNEEVLHHANIHDCNMVVIASSNIDEVEACLHSIKQENPKAYVITRVATEVEAERLKHHGANVAISDELESNFEILITVLDYLDLPARDAYKFSAYIRTAALEASLPIVETTVSKDKPLFKWLRRFS